MVVYKTLHNYGYKCLLEHDEMKKQNVTLPSDAHLTEHALSPANRYFQRLVYMNYHIQMYMSAVILAMYSDLGRSP